MRPYPEEFLSWEFLPATAAMFHPLLSQLELCEALVSVGKPFPKQLWFFTNEEMESLMATKGRKQNGSTRGVRSNAGRSGGDVRWINVRLSDDDKEMLAGSPAELPELAAMACELVAHGKQLGIKPMDAGDSIMAYLIWEPDPDSRDTVGVSAFATNPRDALLCVLFKFEDKLESGLSLPDVVVSDNASRFR